MADNRTMAIFIRLFQLLAFVFRRNSAILRIKGEEQLQEEE